jgi:hypothetical protein
MERKIDEKKKFQKLQFTWKKENKIIDPIKSKFTTIPLIFQELAFWLDKDKNYSTVLGYVDMRKIMQWKCQKF